MRIKQVNTCKYSTGFGLIIIIIINDDDNDDVKRHAAEKHLCDYSPSSGINASILNIKPRTNLENGWSTKILLLAFTFQMEYHSIVSAPFV